MRKTLCNLLALLLCIGASALVGCAQKGESGSVNTGENTQNSASNGVSAPNEENSKPNHRDLNAYFADAEGKVSLTAQMNMEVDTAYISGAINLGSADVEEIVIDGGEKYTLEITGVGGGCIQANGNGTLVLKNLTVENASGGYADAEMGFRAGYADFGGKVRFENCDITGAIQIHGNADVTFENCRFVSQEENMYAVWISQGNATFQNCSFTGYRAIKLYEGSDSNATLEEVYDVKSVTVDGCTFRDISKKPGLAIDLMDEGESAVLIKDCEFRNCQDVKSGAFGVDGIYESKTEGAMEKVCIENSSVDGVLYE